MIIRTVGARAQIQTPDGSSVEAWQVVADQYQAVAAVAGHPIRLQLAEDDEGRDSPLSFDGDSAVLTLYGPLDPWFGCDVPAIVRELNEKKPKQLTILISSPGGRADAGLQLADALVRMMRPADARGVSWGMGLAAEVENYAASAAVLPLEVATDRRIAPSGQLMIHRPYGLVLLDGHLGQMERQWTEAQQYFGRIENQQLMLLERHTKRTRPQLEEAIRETDYWMDAEQALAAGFVDQIEGQDPPPAPAPQNNDPSPESKARSTQAAAALRQLQTERRRY